MPPIYRTAEVILYSLLNFLPSLALALYPFRRNFRFSPGITAALIGCVTALQAALGCWAAFSASDHAGQISAVSTLLYAAFYFLAVKKHPGKIFFALLMISNLTNLAVIAAKCAEGALFPALAVQNYRWSFSLMLFFTELLIAAPLFFYVKKVFTPAVEAEPTGREWRYLWLIPATFYVIWYYAFYLNRAGSSLEIALRPQTTLFLLAVNVGAILIYYVISCLIAEQCRTLELTERNHQLTMQTLQYENLQEKIHEARRAGHDVRHHIALMREYLAGGDYTALRAYLDQYDKSLPQGGTLRCCDNAAANAVLVYFAGEAKNAGIDWHARTHIPKDAGIPDTDVSVLFGNLLENAVEACRREPEGTRRITVRADTDGGALCLTVDNTCTLPPRCAPDGTLLSAKHEGAGMGTRSVRTIAEKHGGVCRWEIRDGMFCASVLCPVRR